MSAIAATRPRVYLLDVEGTTSPVSLVSEQLFPYARRHFFSFLEKNASDAEVRADLALLAEEYRAESDEKQILRFAQDDKKKAQDDKTKDQDDKSLFVGSDGIDSACRYLLWLMDQDRKSTALKSLQGKVWKAGYESGELVGTVFPDVREAFERWSKTAKIAIYSSGSVEAQKLIFRYSSAGDLTPFISAYFDTRIGAKTSPASYRAIAEKVQATPRAILFVSDVLRELEAAREAGCQTRLALRDGNAAVAAGHDHQAIHSFEEIG
jgi:enolase-phosphatase E1